MEERIWEFSVFTPMGLGDIIWEESREGDQAKPCRIHFFSGWTKKESVKETEKEKHED